MAKHAERKFPIVPLVLVVAAIALFAVALQQQWANFTAPPEEDGGEKEYTQVTLPGHEETPFIESPEGDMIVPEEKVPVVRFFNQTSQPKNVSVPLNYRVKFINQESGNYTLQIPSIGIEQNLMPGEEIEANFYKVCDCAFWLDGMSETAGVVSVS